MTLKVSTPALKQSIITKANNLLSEGINAQGPKIKKYNFNEKNTPEMINNYIELLSRENKLTDYLISLFTKNTKGKTVKTIMKYNPDKNIQEIVTLTPNKTIYYKKELPTKTFDIRI